MMRASNPESQKFRHNPDVAPKSKDFKAEHTAPAGHPNAGLVVDDNGQVVTNKDGKPMHADYDMQGVQQRQDDGSYKKVDTNDPAFQKDMNEDVTPDKPMIQHGANDDYQKPTSDGGTEMGRQPKPDEKYLICEPDGTTRVADNTAQLQNYYEDQGIPWPYQNYN